MSKVLDKLAMILALKGGNGGGGSGGGGGTLIVDYTITADEQSDTGFTVTNHSHTAQEIADAIGEGKNIIARVRYANGSEYGYLPISSFSEQHDDEDDYIDIIFEINPALTIVEETNGHNIAMASSGGRLNHYNEGGDDYVEYGIDATSPIITKKVIPYNDTTQQLGRSFGDIAYMIQGMPMVIIFSDYKRADIVAVDYDNSLTDPYIVIDGLGNRYYAHTIGNNPVKSS